MENNPIMDPIGILAHYFRFHKVFIAGKREEIEGDTNIYVCARDYAPRNIYQRDIWLNVVFPFPEHPVSNLCYVSYFRTTSIGFRGRVRYGHSGVLLFNAYAYVFIDFFDPIVAHARTLNSKHEYIRHEASGDNCQCHMHKSMTLIEFDPKHPYDMLKKIVLHRHVGYLLRTWCDPSRARWGVIIFSREALIALGEDVTPWVVKARLVDCKLH